MLGLSGADGVMIGRGACGRPWFPGALAALAADRPHARPAPAGDALADLVRRHYDALLDPLRHRRSASARRASISAGISIMRRPGVPTPLRRAILTEDAAAGGDASACRGRLPTHPLRRAA